MKKNRLYLKIFLLSFMSIMTALSLSTCTGGGGNDGSTPPTPPEFVGTWEGPAPSPLTGTITFTISETSMTIFGKRVPATDTETDTGPITSYDTSLKHILWKVATVTLTGSATTTTAPGDVFYILYSFSGSTLTVAVSNTDYPTDFTGLVFTMTKL